MMMTFFESENSEASSRSSMRKCVVEFVSNLFDRGFSSQMTALRISFVALMSVFAFAGPIQADSVGKEFTTASGMTLLLLPIVGMKCTEMDKMLARIDATRYRENAPTPGNSADAPLFEYELTLAEENYKRCAAVRNQASGVLNILRRAKSQ